MDSSSNERPCPTLQELTDFAIGKLSSAAIQSLGSHLEKCSSCQNAVGGLEVSSDSLLRSFDLSSSKLAEETEFRQLRARLRDLPDAPNASAVDWDQEDRPRGADAFPADPVVGTPDYLGQYRLLERIGQGAMGTVYKAWHVKLKRHVAIKLLSPRRLNDPEAIDRFSREMEAIGRLDDHPNIVRARDAGETDGHHYLVMDYVEGIDLTNLLCRLGPLKVADACELVRQAARGLDYAHENGFVHRDVKPSNLLLTKQGQVKVLDLGLVAFRNDGRQPSDDWVVGTADYMAPEQWVGSTQVDGRADLYSLGCTLYKLLIGHAPFSSSTFNDRSKRAAHLKLPFPAISSERPDIPPRLEEMINQLTAKVAEDRYQSAAAAAEALLRFSTGCDLPALAQKVSLSDVDTDTEYTDLTHVVRRLALPRSWRVPILGATIGAVVVLGGWFALVPNYRADSAHLAEPHEGQTHKSHPLTDSRRLEILNSFGAAENVNAIQDSRDDAILVGSEAMALVKMGIVEENCTISTQIYKPRWEPRWDVSAGLFFGYREKLPNGGDGCRFETVSLVQNDNGSERAFSVLNSSVAISKENGNSYTYGETKSIPVDIESMKHLLKLEIVGGRLRRVYWDLDLLFEIEVADASPAETSQGTPWGILNSHGSTKFHHATLKPLK